MLLSKASAKCLNVKCKIIHYMHLKLYFQIILLYILKPLWVKVLCICECRGNKKNTLHAAFFFLLFFSFFKKQ